MFVWGWENMGDVIFAKNGVVYPREVQNISSRNAKNSLTLKSQWSPKGYFALLGPNLNSLEIYESLVCVGAKITPIAYSSKKLWIN